MSHHHDLRCSCSGYITRPRGHNRGTLLTLASASSSGIRCQLCTARKILALLQLSSRRASVVRIFHDCRQNDGGWFAQRVLLTHAGTGDGDQDGRRQVYQPVRGASRPRKGLVWQGSSSLLPLRDETRAIAVPSQYDRAPAHLKRNASR